MPVLFQSILPEILLLLLALVLFIFEPFWKGERPRSGWVTFYGLLLVMIASLLFGVPQGSQETFGGMIRLDWFAFLFKMLFIFGAALTALFFMDQEDLAHRGEAHLLLLAATLGMCLMASANDLVMLYLAIETTSIPLYVLAGFFLHEDASTEAGFKYLFFGALTSAVMLYGLSLLYGFAGTTSLPSLGAMFGAGQISLGVLLGILALIAVGLAFKVSVAPFHFWAPDVYHGAPTAVAGFLSTASKAAGFAVLMRFFLTAFPRAQIPWPLLLAILSALTMTIGNLLALPQTNLKRLLAYSSIAHAGYVLIGVVAATQLGLTSVIFYLIVYLITNLAAFGIVMVLGKRLGSDQVSAYNGLSRRSPWLALALLAAFLSLAGMPPFGGFVAKVFVFAAGVEAGYTWLVFVGVLNSIVGLYYYLNVMKYVYLYRLPGEDEEKHPIVLPRAPAIGLGVLLLGVILFGTVFAPWFGLSGQAAGGLF
ncbi:MAG: NADH-quinone oxidoreductase subunit N [Anaerolineales bacterium]